MVKRVTIAVSDELYEDLATVKSEINVSKTCQEAIRRRVETVKLSKQEAKIRQIETAELSNDTDLLKFLRDGKKEMDMEYLADGRVLADRLIKVKNLDFKSFKVIAELASRKKQVGRTDAFTVLRDTVVSELEDDFLWDQIFEVIDELAKEDEAFDGNILALGFITRVGEVWLEIKDKI